MFLLLALLLLLFLPDPWNLVAALASSLAGAAEILFWERRMSRHRVRTGQEALVGATGEVTAPLTPIGQVRVKGELWDAHSSTPLDRGARVQVVAIEDLTLEVAPAGGSSRAAAKARPLLLLLVAGLALAGCGGDDNSGASEDYANGVCTSLSTWATDVEETLQSLADAGLSVEKENVETAVEEVRDANQRLADDLEELEAPRTDAGNEARSELDELGSVLSQQVDAVEEALGSDQPATATAATVSTAISTAATAIDETFQQLRQLEPGDELSDAFESSDACESLRDQLEEDGS
jgi:membrane protein implicated in regulation of membrane protease activity